MPSIMHLTHTETALALKTALRPAADMPKQVFGIHTAVYCISEI